MWCMAFMGPWGHTLPAAVTTAEVWNQRNSIEILLFYPLAWRPCSSRTNRVLTWPTAVIVSNIRILIRGRAHTSRKIAFISSVRDRTCVWCCLGHRLGKHERNDYEIIQWVHRDHDFDMCFCLEVMRLRNTLMFSLLASTKYLDSGNGFMKGIFLSIIEYGTSSKSTPSYHTPIHSFTSHFTECHRCTHILIGFFTFHILFRVCLDT